MTEVMEAIIAFLKDDSGVANLVGTHVYPLELPKDLIDYMPMETIIVSFDGGRQDTGTGPIVRVSMSFESTGEKFYQAGQVDKAVYSALKSLKRKVYNDILLHSALPNMSSPGRAAITGWPVVTRTAMVISDSGV